MKIAIFGIKWGGGPRILSPTSYLDTRNVGHPPGALADVHVAPSLSWISFPEPFTNGLVFPERPTLRQVAQYLYYGRVHISCQEGKIGRVLTKFGLNSGGEVATKTWGRTCFNFTGPKHPFSRTMFSRPRSTGYFPGRWAFCSRPYPGSSLLG